jgi:hypothetical protein
VGRMAIDSVQEVPKRSFGVNWCQYQNGVAALPNANTPRDMTRARTRARVKQS